MKSKTTHAEVEGNRQVACFQSHTFLIFSFAYIHSNKYQTFGIMMSFITNFYFQIGSCVSKGLYFFRRISLIWLYIFIKKTFLVSGKIFEFVVEIKPFFAECKRRGVEWDDRKMCRISWFYCRSDLKSFHPWFSLEPLNLPYQTPIEGL